MLKIVCTLVGLYSVLINTVNASNPESRLSPSTREQIDWQFDLKGISERTCNIHECPVDEYPPPNPICCNQQFKCLSSTDTKSCVFREGQVAVIENLQAQETRMLKRDYCLQNYTQCYHCCFDGKCGNFEACNNNYETLSMTAQLVFIVVTCLFIISIASFSVLIAVRKIRLNKLRELRLSHKNMMSDIALSNNQSARESQDVSSINDHEITSPMNK